MRIFTILGLLLSLSAQADDWTVVSHDKYGKPQKYFTGYVKDPNRKVQIREFPKKSGAHAFEDPPEEFYAPEVRIFKQECGDCWAQGGSTAFESLVSLMDKVSIFVSRQQVIDCSGFGSCGGGDISIGNFVKPKGAAYESDYPYQGNDQRCKSAPLHESAESDFDVKDLTVPTLQRAMMEVGPLEVCGAASALEDGGWVEGNHGGGTNHCYSFNGWYRGEKHGHKPGIYFIIVNSWGKDWGDNGKGYYLMAEDGVHFDGNVITEAGGVVYKPACTPQPISNAGSDKNLILAADLPHSVRVGSPALAGMHYQWSGPGISDPNSAQPFVSPTHTTQYTLDVTSQCGKAMSSMVVHVFHEVKPNQFEEIK